MQPPVLYVEQNDKKSLLRDFLQEHGDVFRSNENIEFICEANGCPTPKVSVSSSRDVSRSTATESMEFVASSVRSVRVPIRALAAAAGRVLLECSAENGVGPRRTTNTNFTIEISSGTAICISG